MKRGCAGTKRLCWFGFPSNLLAARCLGQAAVATSFFITMRSFRFTLQIFLTSTAVLFLAACSGEPSESDLEKMVQSSVRQVNVQMGSLGSKTKAELHGLKKLGCKSDAANAYLCDIEVDATHPLTGRNKTVSRVRTIKGSDGWVATP